MFLSKNVKFIDQWIHLPLSPAPSSKIFRILGRSLANASNCLSISSLRLRAIISSRSNVKHAPINYIEWIIDLHLKICESIAHERFRCICTVFVVEWSTGAHLFTASVVIVSVAVYGALTSFYVNTANIRNTQTKTWNEWHKWLENVHNNWCLIMSLFHLTGSIHWA